MRPEDVYNESHSGMSAEPRRVTNPEVWTRWEGQVVKGVYPLRRFLGGSGQGAVFLSTYDAGKPLDVAIKIGPAVGSQAEARLAHWRTAAALSHPNLVRLFDMGRCQLAGREFLFIVMEHGEQTLAEFLAQRALTVEEVRALLPPTLDALAFLHSNQLVHSQLKPSNFLVVNDQLKLTSDAVRPLGHRGLSNADDICSLGMTLVEAFTQRTLSSPDDQDELSVLLSNVPGAFATTVRRCLHPNPANRPTVSELQGQLKSTRSEEGAEGDRPHAHPLLLAPAALLLSLAAWIALKPSGKSEADSQPPAVVAPAPARTPAATSTKKPSVSNPRPSAAVSEPSRFDTVSSDPSSPVVLEIMPEVPLAMSDRIEGRILVSLRVLVDSSGNVMGTLMEKSGPNKDLANLADQAAREWKFVPADEQATRVWILTFAFTRDGVTARATAV